MTNCTGPSIGIACRLTLPEASLISEPAHPIPPLVTRSTFPTALPTLGLALVLFALLGEVGPAPGSGARSVLALEVERAVSPPILTRDRAPAVPTADTVVLRVSPLPVPVTLPVAPEPTAPPPYSLVVPVAGVLPEALVDTFGDFREDSTRTHRALDILAPTGTPVVAAAPGHILRLHTSTRGGLTVYHLGPTGRYIYYYAHLDAYADSLQIGQTVAAGDTLGIVGATGNADAAVPHLHFAIWRQRRGGSGWGGTPVNPFEALTR